jgi:hypothetical protein
MARKLSMMTFACASFYLPKKIKGVNLAIHPFSLTINTQAPLLNKRMLPAQSYRAIIIGVLTRAPVPALSTTV